MLTQAFFAQIHPFPADTISSIVSLMVPKKPVPSKLLREAGMLAQAKTEILQSHDWVTANEISNLVQFRSANPSSQPKKWKPNSLERRVLAINLGEKEVRSVAMSLADNPTSHDAGFAGCSVTNAAPTGDPMFADVMHKDTYRAYRVRLQALLQIPTDASDQEIQQLIEAGFPAGMIKVLSDLGMISTLERDQIISLKTLKARLAQGQRLTLHESDRLFRVAHITAIAMVVFGSDEKSKRWLSKPNGHFSGKRPIAMLFTTQESRQVEEMLIKIAEGFAF